MNAEGRKNVLLRAQGTHTHTHTGTENDRGILYLLEQEHCSAKLGAGRLRRPRAMIQRYLFVHTDCLGYMTYATGLVP